FAPGWVRAAIFALVLVHGFHELDFFVVVIAFAGGRVDLPAALPLLAPIFAAAAFNGHGNVPLAALIAAPIGNQNIRVIVFVVVHGRYLKSALATGKVTGSALMGV